MSTNQSTNTGIERKEYIKRVWIAVAIVALVTVLLLIIKATFSVFLLLLAGALVAIFFTGLSDLICRATKWKSGICMTISVVGTFLIIAGLIWLIGSKVTAQAQQLSETIPTTIENARNYLSKSSVGQEIINKATSQKTMEKAQRIAGSFFQSTFGILGDIYIVLLLAIFFVVSPSTYKEGIVKLVPAKGREKADEVLDKLADNLKKWLKGKIFAMFVVFVLTAAGLLIMGMPLWLVLAIIAGFLNFIPNFGPLIAMVPAVLVGLLQGPTTALIVAGMYMLIQTLESNLITPTIQQKLVSIPPALIIIAQLLIAPLTGFWGLILATPLMLITIVLTKQLYVKEQEHG